MRNFWKNKLAPFIVRMITWVIPVLWVYLLQLKFSDANIHMAGLNTFIFMGMYGIGRIFATLYGDFLVDVLLELFWFVAYHVVMAMLRTTFGKLFVVGVTRIVILIKNVKKP